MTRRGVTGRPAVALDCRWLGIGGAGTLTELLLQGLREQPPPSPWVLWGAPEVADLAWPGAQLVESVDDPRSLMGQRDAFRVPAGDLVVFMHQQRPLRNLRAATVVLDTIPLRHGSNGPARALKRRYLKRVAAISERLITISAYSARCIERDLAVDPQRIAIVPVPCDEAHARRILALRETSGVAEICLYVGNFLPHKNLPRLLQAFFATRFHADGGRLVLVGGSMKDRDRVLNSIPAQARGSVTMQAGCGQAELDGLFATARFLVQPSLEEGFGLPAWEAVCCGLPVAASRAGSLPEVLGDRAEYFDPASVPDMARAMDRCADRARRLPTSDAIVASEELRRAAPAPADLAAAFCRVVADCTGSGGRNPRRARTDTTAPS
jgi:glycosyltransferase involved in cell wall biosynthesis